MNADVLKGKWKQMRGQVQKWWGDLTDDDLDRIEGERDKLIGRLQERYGYTRENAEAEVDRRFSEYERMVGANTFRLLMAAARTLWFIVKSAQHADVALQRLRPWYRHKVAPSQFDVAWACREDLQEAGIFLIPRIFTAVPKNQQELDKSELLAA